MRKELLVIAIVIILLISATVVVSYLVFFKDKEEYYEVIVGLKELPSVSISSFIEKFNAMILEKNEKIDTLLVKIKKGLEQEFIDEILGVAGVEYVELNDFVHAFHVPNDPWWDRQWGPERIKCPDSWDFETGSKSVKIAIIDTGIDYNHEDLSNCVFGGYDFVNDDNDPMDDNGHGTHCAGIAAAVIDNEIGIAGVAQVSLMAVKVLDEYGSGHYSEVADGIVYAVDNDVDIISMSLGSSISSSVIEDACNYAWDSGVILVAASGNDYSNQVSYPARYDTVIAVGSIDQDDERSSFSNYGDELELVAPGEVIISSIPGNNYEFYGGTSMACPHVAGVAALAISRHPNFTNQEIRELLKDTADDLGSIGWDEKYGYGRVDASFDDESLVTQPALSVNVHKITRIDPMDPGDDKPEWYYKITSEYDDTDVSDYNYNGYNKKFLFWWRFVWNSEYTWEVDKTHELNVNESVVIVKIKLMENDLLFDDIADISSSPDREITQFKYDLKNNTILDDDSDKFEKDGEWYVANGEFDDVSDAGEKDAKLWFKISDNYEPPHAELKDIFWGRKNEEITLIGEVSHGLEPYEYFWDMDDDGVFDDASGKIVKFSWSSPGTHVVKLKVVDAFGQSDINITNVIIDETPPKVAITKPLKHSLYVHNAHVLPLPLLRTRIIGPIDIEINASDDAGIDKIQIYIDNELKTTLTEEPYIWTWNEKKFFIRHKIRVVAYDKLGNSASNEIIVKKFF